MPLRSYAMSLELIEGLEELSVRERTSINELVRRAVRRELEREGVQQISRTVISTSRIDGSDGNGR